MAMSQQVEYDAAEYQARTIEFANRLALKRPDLNLLRGHPREEFPVITESLEYLLKERDAQRKLVLPNLAAFNNDAVGIFSDYSGENSGSYMTYSVLICGYNFISAYSEKMKKIRERYGLGEKEIGFKSFGMGQVQASLSDFWQPPIRCPASYARWRSTNGLPRYLVRTTSRNLRG
jgi:hypothetical protein